MPETNPPSFKGRGAQWNPTNRFEKFEVERLVEEDPDAPTMGPKTQLYNDRTQSILSYNDSPDLGMGVSVNPYRGCEHGCTYCYARPFHEYLGFSAGLDFESKIMVKKEAPHLLRKELMSPKWQPQTIVMSGVTDCYQPIERHLGLTRQCLQVLAEFHNPVAIITKSQLVTRDIDVLQELAKDHAACVCLSITTLDPELSRAMEPRAALPQARLAAVEALAKAGIPVSINIAPVVPGLTDHEIPSILKAAFEKGARSAGYVILRLPYGVKDIFQEWLVNYRPLAAQKVFNRIRDVRGGKLYDSTFGKRMKGEGFFAEQIAELFAVSKRKVGYSGSGKALSTAAFKRPLSGQLSFFEV